MDIETMLAPAAIETLKFGILFSVLLNVATALTGEVRVRVWASGVTAITFVWIVIRRRRWMDWAIRSRVLQPTRRPNWVWVIARTCWGGWLLGVTMWADWTALTLIAGQDVRGRSLMAFVNNAGWLLVKAIVEVWVICLLHLAMRLLLFNLGRARIAEWTRYGVHLKRDIAISRTAFLLSKSNLALSFVCALALAFVTGDVAWLFGCVFVAAAAGRDFEAWTLLTLPKTVQVGETGAGDLLIYLSKQDVPPRIFQATEAENNGKWE